MKAIHILGWFLAWWVIVDVVFAVVWTGAAEVARVVRR